MEIFVVTFLFFVLSVIFMALGVICTKKPIQGSCGGIAGTQGNCKICSGIKTKCNKNASKSVTKKNQIFQEI